LPEITIAYFNANGPCYLRRCGDEQNRSAKGEENLCPSLKKRFDMTAQDLAAV
jgi:hypothetical protein